MAEILTLTTPVSGVTTTTFKIVSITFGVESPSIKVDLVYNTGIRETYRMIPDENTTLAQVKAALKFINEGKFKTVDNKSLHKFLLDEIALKLGKPGTVTGTVE